MSHFVGAWLLKGSELAPALSHRVRSGLARRLARNSQHFLGGRFWLVAPSPLRAVTPQAVCASVGFSVPSPAEVLRANQRGEFQPDGPCACVLADLERGKLALIRGLSGGERLYFLRREGVLFFATSLRILLDHPDLIKDPDLEVVDQFLLSGHSVVGDRTALRGICEVLAGHCTWVTDTVRQELHYPGALRPAEGDSAALARTFRRRLTSAVLSAAGRLRPVPIALSGGIDSAAIAAAAVDAVGAKNIYAFSYEFDDTAHRRPETQYAREVCRALAIRNHEVFRISEQSFLDSIVEHVWRSESAVHWPKAFLLPVAKFVKSRGFDRYLTGFGVGSHFGYLREFSRVLPWIPAAQKVLGYWKWARFEARDEFGYLKYLHPGLEPPHPRLYDFMLRLLERDGVIATRSNFYPPEMAGLLRRGQSPQAEARETLFEELVRHTFGHTISCVDVTRSEKASRELGVYRISPAHFSACLPFAYFQPLPPPRFWSAARYQRPGKYLLQLAFRDCLPDEVLFRRKNWDDAVTSRAWRRKGRVRMLRALPRFPFDMAELRAGYPEAVSFWDAQSIQASCLAFWFWYELCVRRAADERVPSWDELWRVEPNSDFG